MKSGFFEQKNQPILAIFKRDQLRRDLILFFREAHGAETDSRFRVGLSGLTVAVLVRVFLSPSFMVLFSRVIMVTGFGVVRFLRMLRLIMGRLVSRS